MSPLLTTFAGAALRDYGFGAGGAAAPAFELISTVAGTGASGTITFSSIPSTYKHLQIRSMARGSGAAQIINLRINSTTANHATHWLQGDGTGVTASNLTTQNSIWLSGAVTPSTGAANAYTPSVIDILEYGNTNKIKTVRWFAGQIDAQNLVAFGSGMLPTDTTAISSLTLSISVGSFTTASRFSLYGIKGS